MSHSLTSEPARKGFFGEIASLAIPAFLEKFLLKLIGFVSTIILGRVVGTDAMSAVSVARTLPDILLSIYLGLGFGASIIIAKEDGDRPHVNKITVNAIFLNGGLGLLLGGICFIFCRPIFRFLFASKAENVAELAISYLRIALPFSAVDAIDAAISSALRGAHDAKTPFLITLLVNVLNAILCTVFIGFFGMGVIGAAVSYAISAVTGCLIRGSMLFRKKSVICLTGFQRPDFQSIRRISRAGIASALQACFINFAFLGMQAVTALISSVHLAAYTIANNIITLSYCITHGSQAAQITLVANHVGRGDKKTAHRYGYGIFWLSQAVCCSCGVLIFIFARPLSSIFIGSQSEEVLSLAVTILRVLCFAIPLTATFQASEGALKVGNEAAVILISNLSGPWLVRLPLAYLLVTLINRGALWTAVCPLLSGMPALSAFAKPLLSNGLTGFLTALFCDYLFRAIIHYTAFRKERWLSSDL